MVWTTIPNTDIDADSPITVALMNSLRDNTAAMANGDAGAPKVQTAAINDLAVTSAKFANDSITASKIAANGVGQSEIVASAVGQSELKSATASQSHYFTGVQNGEIVLTGGSYTMGWFLGASPGANIYISSHAHFTTYAARVGMRSTSSSPRTGYVYSRYIQASPPYNLGNGDIPVFVYALMAKAGNRAGIPAGTILATSVAADPSWAYHGSDHISPKNIITSKGKKQYELVKRLPWPKTEALADSVKLQENIAALANPVFDQVEITMTRKLRNMPNVPHPFEGNANLAHGTVVLVDPFSQLAMAAAELVHEDDHATISEMLAHPSLVIDSVPISGLATPPSVMGVKVTL